MHCSFASRDRPLHRHAYAGRQNRDLASKVANMRVAKRARRLTPRSKGAPTAGHQGPVRGTVYIFSARALAPCRWRPLSSNVRLHKMSFCTAACSANSAFSFSELNLRSQSSVRLGRRWRFAPRAEARSRFVRAATGGKSRSRQLPACALLRANMRRLLVKYPLQYQSGVLAVQPAGTNTSFEQGRLWRAPALRQRAAPMPWAHQQRHRRQSAHAFPAWAAPRHTYDGQTRRRGKPIVAPTKPSATQRAKSSGVRGQMQPNPSLKRSANGGPPGPRSGAVYHPLRGPGVPPLAPA